MPISWLDVSDTNPSIAYTANGSQTVFTVPFVFFANGDLKVYVNGILQTITTHYTVAGALNQSGGTVTFLVAPVNGAAVLIVRDLPYALTTHVPPSGPLDIPSLNFQFSRLVVMIQQLKYLLAQVVSGLAGLDDASNVQTINSASGLVGLTAGTVVINRVAPSATALTLPDASLRGGARLRIVDMSTSVTDHTITLTPFSVAQKIMRQATWPMFSNAASLSGVTLCPIVDPDTPGNFVWAIAP